MIRHPKPGQRVQLWYKNRTMPHHGKVAVVLACARGRIRNHAVRLGGGEVVIVPGGNLKPAGML